jgi:hypothetical protein
MINHKLHTCLLLFASTFSTILTVSLVKLPSQVEHKGTTSWVANSQLTLAKQGGVGLIGIKDIVSTNIGR